MLTNVVEKEGDPTVNLIAQSQGFSPVYACYSDTEKSLTIWYPCKNEKIFEDKLENVPSIEHAKARLQEEVSNASYAAIKVAANKAREEAAVNS